MSLNFLKQMAEKYNLVYVKDQDSIYIEFDRGRSNSNYQVAKYYPYERKYVVFPVCEIRGDKIATSNNEKTWVRVKTNEAFEKELIKFVANYKETIIKQKIQTIDKDFV